MKTDVGLLIEALTTERNAIDRAIAALRQIAPTAPAVRADATPRAAKKKRPMFISDATKAAIFARMSVPMARGEQRRTIARLADEYGISVGSIGNWKKWATKAADATKAREPWAAAVETRPEPEPAHV